MNDEEKDKNQKESLILLRLTSKKNEKGLDNILYRCLAEDMEL